MRNAIRRLVRRGGFDVVRYDARRFVELRRLELLHSRRATVVLDVGANDGPFGRELRAAGYRGRIVSFEPQAAAFERLAATVAGDSAWEARRVAVGARDGRVVLHVAQNSSSSSTLPMTDRHVASAPESRYVGDEEVELVRLDSIAPDLLSGTDVVFLKVDVQGAELDVLEGAAAVLEQTAVVDVELSLVELYEGAPKAGALCSHLEARGFYLVAVEPVFSDPSTDRLLQLNGIFARPPA